MVVTKTYAAFSDPHGQLPRPSDLPEVDFLFIGGDLSPWWIHSKTAQKKWFKHVFGPWLKKAGRKARHIVGIAGNHDGLAQTPYGHQLLKSLKWTYLCDETVVIEGLKIHGTPWTVQFNDWAFMNWDWELIQYWNQIPMKGLDVLISHGPPFGVLDLNPHSQHVGSESLKMRLEEIDPPQVAIYGHLHGCRGVHGGMYGMPLSVNVSLVNEAYDPIHDVFVGELEVRS